MFFKTIVCAAMLLFPAFSQTDMARITGNVTDSTGAVVPGAAVVIQNVRTGVTRKITADSRGRYAALNLKPAEYTLTVSAEDLGEVRIPDITLSVGQEQIVNVVLRPAVIHETLTVSSKDMVVIDVSSARIGASVSDREVAQLPLNGREISQLYLLAPGAVNNGSGTYDNIRFSGRSNQQNIIRYDGVEGTSIIDASPGNLNGEVTSSFRLQSSLENVQEFRVDSSNYPAEYGTGTGGQISVITKSGSNDFHGSLFEYMRNDAFDARNFFDRANKSSLRMNQFGGSF